MIRDIIVKANIFPHIYSVLYGTMCLYQKRMAYYEHMYYNNYFDKNNLYSVDNTRYHNIFECIYHIVMYRDIFLQYHDIVIQKISYRGITTSQNNFLLLLKRFYY